MTDGNSRRCSAKPYFALPGEILGRRDLTPTAKVVWAYLHDQERRYARQGGILTEGVAAIGQAIGLNKDTVARAVRQLVAAGLATAGDLGIGHGRQIRTLCPGCGSLTVSANPGYEKSGSEECGSEGAGRYPPQNADGTPPQISDPKGSDLTNRVNPTDHQQATEEHSAASRPASVACQIAALEGRYEAKLATDTREACALSRRSGRMSDTVWLKALRQLDKHPVPVATEAMRTFVDKHADGDRDERYLLGIARRLAKSNAKGPAPVAGHDNAPSYAEQAEQLFGGAAGGRA